MTQFAGYFAWRGRVGRPSWAGRTATAALAAIAFGLLAGSVAGEGGTAVVAAALLVSAASLAARRLHDIGKSAWYLAVGIVPIVGPLWLLFQLTRPGVEGRNRYGDDPDARFDYLRVDIAR